MAPRANWKGLLQVAEVICPVALYTAVSASEQIAFHTINRATGHRVRREFVDAESGEPVQREDQVKGYAVGKEDYVMLEPSEIAAATPESDKILEVSVFVGIDEFDDVYLDTPYYLGPVDRGADEAYALIREGLISNKVAAIARTVLHRRVRTLLIRARPEGMIATTLIFNYEARSAKAAFHSISDAAIKGEMLELAQHIIKTKMGAFDPSTFDDRYENALADLVKAKAAGKTIAPPRREKPAAVVDLMAALRQSAGAGGEKGEVKRKSGRSSKSRSSATSRRKAS